MAVNEVRNILIHSPKRVETGPVKFNADWTGLFIRGDDCFFYKRALIELIEFAENN